MLQQDHELIGLVAAGTIMFLLLGMFIISFLFFYQRKHNTHITEKENLKVIFDKELLKTQLEVQEQTMANISREIHDNITQVLSFVKLNLGLLDLPDEDSQKRVADNRELVSQTINDLRNLSKSISYEHIANLGLVKTLELETGRINNSNIIKLELEVDGDPVSLGDDRELVLFRIFQEALNNTLKYAGADTLKISLQYSDELFTLTLKDNGAGFSMDMLGDNIGAGLRNMKNRANLMGAVAAIDSAPGKGCAITVTLKLFEKGLYDNGTPKDSFS